MPHRLRRRSARRVVRPPPVVATRYLGPATLHVVTERGSWDPRVDVVGLGWARDDRDEPGIIEAILDDRGSRPTLPWWLRTSEPHVLGLHGRTVPVDTPAVRRQGSQTVMRWPTGDPWIRTVLAQLHHWPTLFTPMLERPPTEDERAVLRDYALSTGQPELADWLGGWRPDERRPARFSRDPTES